MTGKDQSSNFNDAMEQAAADLNKVANEWLAARAVIAEFLKDLGHFDENCEGYAETLIARLASHKPPIFLDMQDRGGFTFNGEKQ